MATRFYFAQGSNFASPVSVAVDSAWNLNTSAKSLPLVLSRANSSFSSVNFAETSASSVNILHRRYVSEPIAAQTISGTAFGMIRASQTNVAAAMSGQLIIRVVSYDGTTIRGTLYGGDTTSTVVNAFTTTLSSRPLPGSTLSGVTLSNVTAQEGDRIVVEVGVRAHNTVTTSYNATTSQGDGSSSDLTTTPGVTTANNPWVEFSANITMLNEAGEGTFLTETFTNPTPDVQLNTHTGESGGWFALATPRLVNGRLYTTSTFADDYVYPKAVSALPTSRDYAVEAVIRAVSLTGAAGVVARSIPSDGANNGYSVKMSPTSITLYRDFSQIGSYSHTPTAGTDYTLTLEATDATKKVFLGGTQVISNTNNNTTNIGVPKAVVLSGSSTTGFHIDSFTARYLQTAQTFDVSGSASGTSSVSADTFRAIGYTTTGTLTGSSTVTASASKASTTTGAIVGSSSLAAETELSYQGEATAEGTVGGFAGISMVTSLAAPASGSTAGSSAISTVASILKSTSGTIHGSSAISGTIKPALGTSCAVTGSSVTGCGVRAYTILSGTIAGSSAIFFDTYRFISVNGSVVGESAVFAEATDQRRPYPPRAYAMIIGA